jgi:DNA polymerase I
MQTLKPYTDVWAVDFEFHCPPGERPEPLCMVAREFNTGQTITMWADELRGRSEAPFPIGPDSLFVAYYASAELGCFLSLGWPMPSRILDLYVEFKWLTSGIKIPHGHSLLGALTSHGIDGLLAVEKASLRELAIRGGPYSDRERTALLEYCQSDVVSLTNLLPAMLPKIDLPRALLRGRYMAAVAKMERAGVPIDTATLGMLRHRWPAIQELLISRIDTAYGVYDGRTFKEDRFAALLARRNIPWPALESGRVALDDDTFRAMAKVYPELSPLRELRHALSDLRIESLAVGSDGRNRCLLSPFGSKTGRNQPGASKFIFGPAVWLRSLIRPAVGWAVAYIDFEQQEFGIAAALSGDTAMGSGGV